MLKITYLIIYSIIITLKYVSSNKTCSKIRNELADAQSHFVYCATNNSIPVNLCQKCASQYYDMTSYYETVKNCTEFFDKDRLNVIPTVQKSIIELWSKAFCDNCYVDQQNTTFMETFKKYETCLTKHNGTNDICNNCTAEYKTLNDYFIKLNQKSNGKVCFDFQDQMNRTRHYWSKTLNCCQREKHLTVFTTVVVLILSAVGTFYIAAYGVIKYKERNHDVLSDAGMLTANEAMVIRPTRTITEPYLTTDSATVLR